MPTTSDAVPLIGIVEKICQKQKKKISKNLNSETNCLDIIRWKKKSFFELVSREMFP